jgi:hypothetical protein
LQEDDLINVQNLDPANFRPFSSYFGYFSGKIPPFFGEKPLFSGKPFLALQYIVCVFAHFEDFSETALHPGRTR